MLDLYKLPVFSSLEPTQVEQVLQAKESQVFQFQAASWHTPAQAYQDLAQRLQFAPDFGANLDALADALADLSERYPSGSRVVLLFSAFNASDLYQTDWHVEFKAICEEASSYWLEQDKYLQILVSEVA